VYFMSMACGRPQGGEGQAHVDACGQREGVLKARVSCGRHKWMIPYINNFFKVPIVQKVKIVDLLHGFDV